jgi:hypothetical protein
MNTSPHTKTIQRATALHRGDDQGPDKFRPGAHSGIVLPVGCRIGGVITVGRIHVSHLHLPQQVRLGVWWGSHTLPFCV